MKASQRSQRRSSHQGRPTVSLFPFLAVLICIMGVLVPLLLYISRTARLQAEATALAKMTEQGSEAQTQLEDVRWRIEQLKKSRDKAVSELADARLDLGHIEDHSRRLRSQLAQYEKTVADLDSPENADRKRILQSKAELEQVRAKIGAAQKQVAQAQEAAAGRTRSFAVVPYEGPNQTRRRPIYLECRADAVVLQPEGIELTEGDFEGPLGPGNPLAAALRAAREYMLAQRDFDPQAGEPYPLLLVRPEGINAYYAARAAMKSWGFDFGYELIDEEWPLAYPPPDPRLAQIARQAVDAGRASEARLAAAAPRQYGSRPKVVYRASPSGGFVPEATSADDNNDRGYRPAHPAGHVGRNEGQAAKGQRRGYPATGNDNGGSTDDSDYNPYIAATSGPGVGHGVGGPGIPGGTGSGVGAGNAGGGVGGQNSANGAGGNFGGSTGNAGDGSGNNGTETSGPTLVGNGASRSGYSQGSSVATGYPAGETYGNGSSLVDGNSGHPLRGGGSASGGTGASNDTGQSASGGSGGSSNPYRSSAEGHATGGGDAGPAMATGQSCPTGSACSGTSAIRSSQTGQPALGEPMEPPEGYIVGQPPRERTASTSSTPPEGLERGRTLGPGEWAPTPEPPPKMHDDKKDKKDKDNDRHSRKPEKSLVTKRGADWGLRDAARGSVGITRPIRIECYADRITVVAEQSPATSKVIALGPRTASSVDAIISAVWEHMETWGMAGRGMYWRPVLQVHVAPDAQNRFDDLSALLDGSGLTIKQSQ